jgi:hypothetical protein
MKTFKILMLLIIATICTSTLSAQISVGVNIGVPSPRYYYLQDIEAYFDINASMYIYLSGGRWIHARNLPSSYGHYDMNSGHKVIINDYRGNRPYNYYREHRSRFPKGHYDNPGKNNWSAKEYKHQRKNNKREFKEYRKENKRAAKEYRKDSKREAKEYNRDVKHFNKGNGNNGNGRGNGHGGGKGKGK